MGESEFHVERRGMGFASPFGMPNSHVSPGTSNVNHKKKLQQRQLGTDEGYDRAVHAERDELRADVFERLERADVNVDGGSIEEVDPENLLAQVEDTISGEDQPVLDELLETSDLEQQDLGAMTLSSSEVFGRLEEDDGGSVSPEELGEQFLRGAAQQERLTHADDRESTDNVDLLGEAVHQVSLFDHNFDPLRDPRLPRVAADETVADENHDTDARAKAKRAAIQNAQDRSAAFAQASSKPSQDKPRQRKSSPKTRKSDK